MLLWISRVGSQGRSLRLGFIRVGSEKKALSNQQLVFSHEVGVSGLFGCELSRALANTFQGLKRGQIGSELKHCKSGC